MTKFNVILLTTIILFLHGKILTEAAVNLRELDRLIADLRTLDQKAMNGFITYNVNRRDRAGYRYGVLVDRAPGTLFSGVDLNALQRKPTIAAFIQLLDNYIQQTGVKETTNPLEDREIDHFLDEVLKTPVMKHTHQVLVNWRLSSANLQDFKQQLKALWFTFYRRDSPDDSSAFEHVFVGETRNVNVLGFHNWIQFYKQEAAGKVDFYGYKRICGYPPEMISIAFRVGNNSLKPTGSMFLGTSPEFEMAVYTAVFLSGLKDPVLNFGSCQTKISCHRLRGNHMSSCFVVL